MKKILVFTLLTIMLVGCGGGQQVATKSYVAGNGTVTFIDQNERKLGPVLTGRTLDGDNYQLPNGGIVVVNVWASWCAPCRAEAPTLAALAEKYKGVVFLGVLTRDSEVAARAFEERFKIPYPTLVDDSVLLGFRETLTANAIPTTLIMDKKGRVAARVSGQVTYSSLRDLIEKIHAE
ncbi:MAG: TlpA family protein disulfide reductase [Candidatus Nanopelagicaceae bacterium]